jgi:hypothetical protein
LHSSGKRSRRHTALPEARAGAFDRPHLIPFPPKIVMPRSERHSRPTWLNLAAGSYPLTRPLAQRRRTSLSRTAVWSLLLIVNGACSSDKSGWPRVGTPLQPFLSEQRWRMISPARADRGPGAVLATQAPDSVVAGWVPVPSVTSSPSLLLKEWSDRESLQAGSDAIVALGGTDLGLALQQIGVRQYHVSFGDATIVATSITQLQSQVPDLTPELTDWLRKGADVVVEALTVNGASIEFSETSTRATSVNASLLADAAKGRLTFAPTSDTSYSITVKQPVVLGVRTTTLRTTDTEREEQLKQAYEHIERLLSLDGDVTAPGLLADGASPMTLDEETLAQAERAIDAARLLGPNDWRATFYTAHILRAKAISILRAPRPTPELALDAGLQKYREAIDLLSNEIDQEDHAQLQCLLGALLSEAAELPPAPHQKWREMAVTHLSRGVKGHPTWQAYFTLSQAYAGLRRPED